MNREDFGSNFPGKIVPTIHDCVAFVPNNLPPKISLNNEIERANERSLLAIGELRAIIPTLPNPKLITRPFLRREALLSSKIEGTSTEMEGLYLFETTKSEGSDKQGAVAENQDAREVSNYVSALQHGLSQLDRLPICSRMFKDMHEILLSGIKQEHGRHKAPGEFRPAQAFVGPSDDIRAARYVAPPQDRVEKLMESLETYINSESPFPTLVNASLLHYQFEAIHPFSDGNGRLGRVLISLYLCATGILPEPLLYISAYFERNKAQYVQNLWEISRSGAWSEWILFFLNGVEHEAKDAADRSRKLIALREQYRSDLQSDGGAGSLMKIVDELFQWPTLTTKSAQKILGMTYQGAKNNIDKLCERKIIDEVTGNYRYRIYLARPIVALMS